MKEMTTKELARVLYVVETLSKEDQNLHDYFWNMFSHLEDDNSRQVLIDYTMNMLWNRYNFPENYINEELEKYDDIINCIDIIRHKVEG